MRPQWQQRVDEVKKYKAERGCIDCGNKDHRVLEFHHRDPSTVRKKSTGNRIDIRTCSFILLRELFDMCDILCANCHKIRHYEEKISVAGDRSTTSNPDGAKLICDGL